jgi:hypothetical protein
MFVGHALSQGPESTRLILLVIASGMVIFWRTVIKFIIIAAILLAVLGALTLSQSLH